MRQVVKIIQTGYRGKSIGLTIPKEMVEWARWKAGDRVLLTLSRVNGTEGMITMIKEKETDDGQRTDCSS